MHHAGKKTEQSPRTRIVALDVGGEDYVTSTSRIAPRIMDGIRVRTVPKKSTPYGKHTTLRSIGLGNAAYYTVFYIINKGEIWIGLANSMQC